MVGIKIRNCLLTLLLLVVGNTDTATALKESSRIDIKNLSVSWVSGLNNNVRAINFNGNTKYFKECKIKLDQKSEVKRIIDSYFKEYLNNRFLDDKDLLVTALLKNNDNMNKFINAGFLWNKNSNLSKYVSGKINSAPLGIPSNVAKKLKIDLKDFLLYSSRDLVHRCISSDIAEGKLQTTLAVKQLSTYKLAKLFGVDSLVVKSEFVKLITKYGEKTGVLTDQATGINDEEIDKTNLTIDPNFQKDLTSLQIFDTITNEQDHNPLNCLFKVKNGRLIGLTAFDNEACFGLSNDLKNGLCWNAVTPLLTRNNKINLPYIDKTLAEKILATKSSDIVKTLKDLLSDRQIESCVKRFELLKAALANTVSCKSACLLGDKGWSRDTMLKEASGNYGNTYFTHYLKKMSIKIK